MSIRFKVIVPYLLLTLLVAVTGVYVVTRLVAGSLNERLTNQLLEAGRVVSDALARQELKHVEIARLVAHTVGVAEAIQQNDKEALRKLVTPLAAGLQAETIVLIGQDGGELLHLLRQPDGSFLELASPSGVAELPLVQDWLNGAAPQAPPRRGLGSSPQNGRYDYYTSLPIVSNNAIVGVVLVGTSLDTLLPYLKTIALADIIFYGNGGQAIATTLSTQGIEGEQLAALSIPTRDYLALLLSDNLVQGQNFTLDGRSYSLARGPLRVGNDRIGVFAVVLPSQYVIQPSAVSRTTYVLLYTLAMAGVVAIGYAISRLIINPLYQLVRTSQAISQGDLNQRSGIRSTDEIGILASSFDEMTAKLQQRTAELERMYRVLEQMDRTKSLFLDVSAHELRSPLTTAKGYAQMIQWKTQNDPDLQVMAKGLLEGIERMAEIVNNMLDVSRIDSQALKPVPEWTQIAPLILRVRKQFQEALQERNLTLTTDGLNGLPPVYADPDLLFKVFYHLIMNAIKYTPDGGRIAVYGRTVEGDGVTPELEIVVEDSGIGIAPEHHAAIFEKFFQIGEVLFHSSGKTKFKGGGAGLGLAIARGIIVAHGGRIWVESPGYDETTCPGSKFFIRLPLSREDTQE